MHRLRLLYQIFLIYLNQFFLLFELSSYPLFNDIIIWIILTINSSLLLFCFEFSPSNLVLEVFWHEKILLFYLCTYRLFRKLFLGPIKITESMVIKKTSSLNLLLTTLLLSSLMASGPNVFISVSHLNVGKIIFLIFKSLLLYELVKRIR